MAKRTKYNEGGKTDYKDAADLDKKSKVTDSTTLSEYVNTEFGPVGKLLTLRQTFTKGLLKKFGVKKEKKK